MAFIYLIFLTDFCYGIGRDESTYLASWQIEIDFNEKSLFAHGFWTYHRQRCRQKIDSGNIFFVIAVDVVSSNERLVPR